MANKKIEQLTDDTGVNMTVNDLLPFAKYVSPGVYTTVFKKGSNIINTITALPTASFTNINTSINTVSNNIIPSINSQLSILNVFTTSQSIASGSSVLFQIGAGQFAVSTFANRPYFISVKLYAYSNAVSSAVKMQEYVIGFCNGTVLGGGGTSDAIYEYADAGGSAITLNPGGFSYHSGSDSLRFSASHSIVGEFVSVIAKTIIYTW